jgi:DNA polymerase-4
MEVRDVFHVRLKGMELQAEQNIDPSLRKRPVAILSSHCPNATIIFLSPEAEEEGLLRGMKLSTIRKVNHGVRLLPYNKSLYTKINYYIYKIVSSFTPVVEPNNMGEFFLDMNGMSHLKGDIQNNAFSILKSIKEKSNIFGQIGISQNKLVSQTITSVVLDKIHEVKNGYEAKFFSNLNPNVLPILAQQKVNRIIKFLLIKKIKNIQSMVNYRDEFKILFGVHSNQLEKESYGKDSCPVRPIQKQGSILRQIILPEDTNSNDILKGLVKDLAEQIAFQLRKIWRIANKCKVEIHYSDGYLSNKIGRITDLDDFSVFKNCYVLFQKANKRRNRIRAILIQVSHFTLYNEQITIFKTESEKSMVLSKTIEKIRLKYGFDSIQTANIFKVLGKI